MMNQLSSESCRLVAQDFGDGFLGVGVDGGFGGEFVAGDVDGDLA